MCDIWVHKKCLVRLEIGYRILKCLNVHNARGKEGETDTKRKKENMVCGEIFHGVCLVGWIDMKKGDRMQIIRNINTLWINLRGVCMCRVIEGTYSITI